MGMPTATVQPSTNQSNGKGQSGNAPRQFQQPDGLPAMDSQMMSPAVIRNDGLDQNAINANPLGFAQWQNDRAQFQQSQQPQGKGSRNITMPSQGGQPRMGMPNAYSNTIQPWDNASIQPQARSGKGKGY